MPTPTEKATQRVGEVPSEPDQPFYQRYWPLGLLLFAVLVFLIPLITVLRDILREGRLKRKE